MTCYGYSCFNCKAQSPEAETAEECDEKAHELGWVLGHMYGQAYYSCFNCSEIIFDPVPIGGTKYYDQPN